MGNVACVDFCQTYIRRKLGGSSISDGQAIGDASGSHTDGRLGKEGDVERTATAPSAIGDALDFAITGCDGRSLDQA